MPLQLTTLDNITLTVETGTREASYKHRILLISGENLDKIEVTLSLEDTENLMFMLR